MIAPPLPENEAERLNALISLNILDTKDEERFDRITRIVKKLFDVPIVLISLVDKDRQWFKSRQGLNAHETSREISFCGHAILNNQVMIIEDATHDIRFNDNPLVQGEPNIKFYLGCPLRINNAHNVGTLCLIDQKPRQFSKEDIAVICDLGAMVQQELESLILATSDELTTLTNRRGFLLIANYVFNLCNREKKPLSLLYFDLDKFKSINDTYGHAEGDHLLKIFAQHLLKQFRSADVVARLGGDEFCVLCSGINKNQTQQLIDRLRMSLNTHQENNYTIKFSVGCIEYDEHHHPSMASMLKEADEQMYENKKIKKQGLHKPN